MSLTLLAGRNARSICAKYRMLNRGYASEVNAVKPTQFGQPMHLSHPHLLRKGETTPGVPEEEYERRRKALMDSLPDDSLVVSVAGQVKYMSGQIFYKFRQASDFWYLTGFEEPDSAVVLEKTSSSRGYRMTMFSSGKDSAREIWEGARTSFQDAITYFKSDDSQPISQFPSILKSLASYHSNIYLDIPQTPINAKRSRLFQKSILKYLSPDGFSSKTDYESLVDSISSSKRKPLGPEVAKLRVFKSDVEQKLMRAAGDISGRAHGKTMRFTEPGMSEHLIASHFQYLCQRDGAQRLAYVPVVASGPNSLIIHYTSNNQIVRDGEMILIDAACEYNGYASDITRTYPVSGKFTSAQAELYGAVLAAQKHLVTLCSESSYISLAELHRESCILIRKELNRIGFNLHGHTGTSDVEAVLYPHYVGHPIGIDLHESSEHYRSRKLQAGMVVTVEPGVYVPPSPSFPTHFHNMGVRIEDEVLIGKNHPVVLSVNAPKEIADVEGACQGLLGLEAF
ncbi:hypothetical protein QCA50_007703 [Cerrena zonata]|uniref:Aminopeptidase P N-terminal domain-containing protein n=1 Tax=Cerrena zonata TaxID=2478898 RepID=A0AAW0GBT5_9APHY